MRNKIAAMLSNDFFKEMSSDMPCKRMRNIKKIPYLKIQLFTDIQEGNYVAGFKTE